MNHSKALGSSGLSGRKPIMQAIRAVVFGTVGGAAICAVLLGVFSLAFVSSENIPQAFLSPFIIGVSVLSSFFSGFVAAKISRKRGLAYGAISAFLLFLLFLICGLTAASEAISPSSVTKMISMVIAGSLGGLLAVNKSRKK